MKWIIRCLCFFRLLCHYFVNNGIILEIFIRFFWFPLFLFSFFFFSFSYTISMSNPLIISAKSYGFLFLIWWMSIICTRIWVYGSNYMDMGMKNRQWWFLVFQKVSVAVFTFFWYAARRYMNFFLFFKNRQWRFLLFLLFEKPPLAIFAQTPYFRNLSQNLIYRYIIFSKTV